MKKVTIHLDGETHTIEVQEGQTILEAAEAAQLDPPFSCRSAICSTCMAKVISGSVSLDMNNVLTDSELEEGFIVTCQAHPTTDHVEITYDF